MNILSQIYSDEVGYSKPNPKMFQLVHDEINSFKNVQKNVIHIGDNQTLITMEQLALI
jgi:putative hydrolase of the HAD superfamily